MSISNKKDSWDESDLADALKDFYDEIPDSVEVNTTTDAPPSAYTVATLLNNLRDELELVRHVEPGIFGGEYSLVDGWPSDDDVPEIAWEQSGQVIKDIAEKVKSARDIWSALGGDSNPRDYFLSGRKPGGDWEIGSDDFTDSMLALLDAAEEYLQQFPQLGFSVKKDVAPLPDVGAELGPTTIACDPNMEASLQFQTNQTHYIGRLEGEEGIFSSPYLPVRLVPGLDLGRVTVPRGWDDPNYGVVDDDGDIITEAEDKSKVGIEVPLGFEITIVEIVQSKEGTWVGFVTSDDSIDNDIFADNTRVLYTKAEYVRIKEDALNQIGPDPYVSEAIEKSIDSATKVIKGAKTIDPTQSTSWERLEPEDVKLQYYHFFDYNLFSIGGREIDGVSDGGGGLVYTPDSISNYQSLRYSEGFFYFIVGSAPRKTEAEIINESDQDLDLFPEELEKQKIAQKVVSHEEMRDNAWDNLLEYLGKSQAGVSQKLIDNLKQNYFVQVARKTNTQTPDPSNEKILFAIRAEYIQSLPKNPRLYKNNFKEGSPFLQGNNYATSFPVSQLPSRCKIIATHLKSLKAKIDESNSTVENANQIEYDLEEQIKVVEEMADIFNEFLHRQAFPLSSNNSALYELIREGVNTSNSEHLIQIGVKDNGQIGGDVRETISYVLFSPDPLQLQLGLTAASQEFTLDYFDPFAFNDEADLDLPRSAISLDVALPWLREKFEGEYGSRALHLLLSYESGNKFLGAKDTKDKWMDYLVKYMVPPVRIYLSKRLSTDEIELECEEIIRKLNNAGPVLTFEERLLQEKLYENEDCMAAYYEKFSKATPAASPGMTKRELEKKAKRTESGGNVLDNQYVKILYTGFFNTLDSSAISALIMACLQKKLGIALTAEAICETAILKLVESTGADSVEKVMLANALLAPGSEASQLFLQAYNGAPPFAPDPQEGTTLIADEDGIYTLDESYNNAPIATSMFLSQKKLSPNLRQIISQIEGISPNVEQLLADAEERGERVNLNDKKWWVMEGDTPRVNTAAVEAIKELERTGQQINLIPAIKSVDEENTNPGQPTIVYYSQSEIDNERDRLKTLGYTKAESDAVMVASGYLMPDPEQYNVVLGDGKASPTPPGGLTGPTGQLPYNYSAVEDARAIEQSAEDWLNYMKGTIGLASICELIVGDILDGFQNLIKDPGAFFSGGGAGWWDSFVEGLKRQLSPKIPTLRFPDFLSTDNHMGDYGEKLLKTILSMVAQMLGQIVNLLLKNALEQCLEEDSDLGPSGRPPAPGPDIPFPTLEAADLPTIDGLSNADIVAWMKDILDNVSTGQLCALLRGDATRQTLLACLGRTQTNWIGVYQGGVNTTSTISSIFRKVGDSVNIDVCNVIDSPALVANLCDAIFDRDARCAALLGAGLTKEECEEQINQEIEDLRNRVAGVAGLNMLDINPLANAFPPICGENGTFTIPPGVRDTMNRITDNMLTNIKGSLMVDMEGLKFFSSPTRALLAATDPEELKRAHTAFLELAKKPKTKKCLALIADPQNHALEYGLGLSGIPEYYNFYEFAYDNNHNFGVPGLIKGFSTYKYYLASNAKRAELFQESEVLPLHVGLLDPSLGGAQLHTSDSDLKEIVTAYVNSKLVSAPSSVSETVRYLNEQIASEYSKDIKIGQLEALTIFEEQIFKDPLLIDNKNFNNNPNNPDQQYRYFPGNLDGAYHDYVQLQGVPPDITAINFFQKQKKVLARSWPLNTKLKDIDNRPWTWYYMLLAYTGLHLDIETGDDMKLGTNKLNRNFPPEWLRDYDFWSTPDMFDEAAPEDFYSGTKFNTSYYPRWWDAYVRSPGLRNLVKIAKELFDQSGTTQPFKRRVPGTKPEDSGSNREFNLAISFMELTVAEAAGLEYDRIQQMYPNMQDYFSNPSNAVVFGSYEAPTINVTTYNQGPVQDTGSDDDDPDFAVYYYGDSKMGFPDKISLVLDEDFKQTQRWNDYEFYYPHFLAFEKIFRDTDADPQELIDRFSGDGEKVNQNLYDRLSFIPDSIMPESLRKEGTVIDILATDLEDLTHDGFAFNTEKYSPNILKYDLGEKLTLGFEDGLDKQALEAISSPDAFARLQTLADQVESLGSKSLIHQNVLTPLAENKEIQTFELKNVSKLIEGITKEFGETVFVEEASETVTVNTALYQVVETSRGEIILQTKSSPNAAFEDAPKEVVAEVLNKIPRILVDTELDPLVVYDIEKLTAGPGILEQNVFATKQFLYGLVPAPENKQTVNIIDAFRATDEQGGLSMRVTNQSKSSPNAAYEDAPTELYSVFSEGVALAGETEFEVTTTQEQKLLSGDPPSPPYAIPDDSRISNETYNFNFAGQLPPDVQNLVQSLYPTNSNLADAFSSDYNILYSDTVLEETNYKAQIFGQLLSKKLNDKLQQYLPTGSSYDQDNLNNIKKFLSVEGFSAMQYAYSTQMFAKMKASRIHNRKFMKKIWKKILKSPMVTDGVDLRCEKNFEKEGVPKDSYVFTETDFFDIEEIKPRIIKLYEDSLCKDVYEENVDGQDSTRMSLLQGMISLVIKVYTLEMCLASVIAWDSFDLEDVFKDTAMTAIILQNISEDFDIEFLSFFATEMLRKESGLTDLQLAELRIGVTGAPQNGLEYLIGKEAESISAIVKDMFVNSFPLTTDLRVSLLKNSDPDFVEDFSREVSNNAAEYPAYKYASYATGALGAPLEYISDVRIKDNIYTMNFGSGKKLPYVDAYLEPSKPWHGGAFAQEYGEGLQEVDLFGLSAQTGFARKNNKNYFHSLPMNWYHAVDADEDRSDYDLWRLNTWKVNPETKRYDQFKAMHAIQDTYTVDGENLGFGSTDCFSFENNVETSHGNDLNLKFGNVVFEPYVRVIDWAENEERNFVAELYVDENGDPCKESTLVGTLDIKDFIEEINEKIDDFRTAKNNVFNCEMRDYVPLSAWSYFFNRHFMSAVNDKENFAIRAFFNNYGLAPFFKKISFGMRMSYVRPMATPAQTDIMSLLREQLNSTDSSTPLKRAKSILVRRPYASILPLGQPGPPGIIDELHIPIVEIEKEIISVGGTNSFRIEEGPLVSFDQMGAGPGQGSYFYVRNPHQFFYNNLANGLLQEIKNSPEFKLMYDYLFPMRRYMALATIMASAGLSKFIAKPTDVLDRTKQSLANIIDNISNSTDYKQVPDPIANLLADRALRAEAGTGGKEPDMTKEILKIVLRTPLLIFKGFVEITDPAIITAKRIIDISNAVAVNTLAAIKQGVATAKRIIQSGIDAAKQLLQQLEMQLSMGVSFAKSAVAALPEVQTSSGLVKMSEYVTIDDGSGAIEEWVLELNNPPFDQGETPSEWTEFKKQFDDLKKLRNEYLKNKKKLEDLERKKRKLEEESKVKIRKAENTVKDVYQSPYLLPGIWAAMVPSVIPYGGGINPFPMPPPFISTFPGMIYLAILFIDAIEEKAHDDMQNTKDPNCEDQL